MPNRRVFVRHSAAIAAGMLLAGPVPAAAAMRSRQPSRREVFVGARRIRTVDIHAHCAIPAAMDVATGTPLAERTRAELSNTTLILDAERLRAMDQQGMDVEALSINSFWYGAERELARDLVAAQNRGLSEWCAKHPDRFVGLASVALQDPQLAADQLDEAVKKLGLRGVAIGGSVGGEDLSARRFDPFWAKVEELGVLAFMHPQEAPGTTENPRLDGKGRLGNVIGNPLETTVFLSHLIFEGTLDRFPGLKICGAHGGGYLPSYVGRSDASCARQSGEDCRALKKRPSDYFKGALFADTMVFREEGLRHLVAECGVSQILYGTDHPYDWPVTVDFVLNASFLTPQDKEAILGGNASRLVRLATN